MSAYTKWEYFTESTQNLSMLNQMGLLGWELVQVIVSEHCFRLIFKRPILEVDF
jgi:hypothetical protein